MKPSLIIDLEGPVVLAYILGSDVLNDRLVRHHARTRHEEPACPEVPTPAFLVQMAKLLQKLPRRFPLDPLHQVARRDMRWAGDEQVDMILAHMPLEDLDFQFRADVPHQLPQADAYIRPQQLLAVFGDPHQMELDVKACVRGPSVMLHPPILTRSGRLKARVFRSQN